MAHSAAKRIRKYDQPAPPAKERKSSVERDELVAKYAPLIKNVAGRLAMRLPSHVDQGDLMSAGIMGLLDAIEKYDPDRGVVFRAYAEFRIRGSMLDQLRAMDWVPRSVRKNAKRLEEAYDHVEKRKMSPATDEEVANELQVDLDAFHKLLDETRGVSMINEEDLGELISHRQVDGLWQAFQDNRSINPTAMVDFLELRDVVAQAIGSLPQNERLVMTLYYYEELTMKEIGNVMGYTESRISQLHTKATIRLRNKMKRYLEAGVVGS
jgi:RNA polymerase sigma factor for flagellar operon FliA